MNVDAERKARSPSAPSSHQDSPFRLHRYRRPPAGDLPIHPALNIPECLEGKHGCLSLLAHCSFQILRNFVD